MLKLLADKPDPTAEEVTTVVASKDFTKDQTIIVLVVALALGKLMAPLSIFLSPMHGRM